MEKYYDLAKVLIKPKDCAKTLESEKEFRPSRIMGRVGTVMFS